MSLFNLIAGDPQPVNPNPVSPLDQLLAMPAPSPAAPQPAFSTPIQPGPGVSVNPSANQDFWQPTHRNILGRIADAMIMAHGGHPVYEQRMRDKDMAEAMQVYDPNDPTKAINRIAKIPGMADQAYKMMEQYGTDQERNQSRDIRDATKKDMIFQRLGGMAGATTSDNFDAMHSLMVNYVKRWGEDPTDYNIPDVYDKDKLDALSEGTLSEKDRQAQALREAAQATRQENTDNTQAYREQRLHQFDQDLSDKMDRFQKGLTVREQEFNRRNQDGGVVTDQGVPLVIGKNGQVAFAIKNGIKYGYTRGPSENGKIKWVFMGPLKQQQGQ